MSLDWRGQQVLGKVLKAVERGVNVTMAAAVLDTKGNHPGWRNITGFAEGSVRIINFATRSGKRVSGEWGSLGSLGGKRNKNNYVFWLEVKHGAFLRKSADRNYPNLAGAIRSSLNG
jgi:hypothetical protein